MNNPTKTVILLLVLGAVALLMSWCAVQSQVAKQIELSEKEIAKQELVIENAKAELAKNKKIAEAGKAYIEALGWNIPDSIPNEAETWIVNDSKPLLRTKTNVACMVWDTINIEEWFAEDYTYESDCWAFSDYGVQGCNYSYEKSPCLLNESLDELNKLLKL